MKLRIAPTRIAPSLSLVAIGLAIFFSGNPGPLFVLWIMGGGFIGAGLGHLVGRTWQGAFAGAVLISPALVVVQEIMWDGPA